MALQGAIPVSFGQVFPYGAFVVGEVTAVNDFDASTKEVKVQQRDKNTGIPVWQVRVMDPDPDARKGQGEVTVKILAPVCPVLPDAVAGLPFRPVEFTGMTVTPYLAEGKFARLAYSFRAEGVQAPTKVPASQSPRPTARRRDHDGSRSCVVRA